MCGIAGIVQKDGRACERSDVVRITRALAHRGPDGEGIHLDGPVGLGHRRLAILDLTESGAQPMPCVNSRYWVTFNGEIFDFVELRRELEAKGRRFWTTSDTEVIGHAYDEWGPDCVLHFNGMWAFAVWDSHKRELFVSRDHFGIKPLYFLDQSDRFVFASELKSFLYLPGFTARENDAMVRRAMSNAPTFQMVEDTVISGVRQLPAGHNLTVRDGRVTISRWWHTLDHLPEVARTFGGQVEQFRELFLDACKIRLRSDVPVGVCLSGGVDSTSVLSSVAALRHGMGGTDRSRVTTDSERAFVITYPGSSWDERQYAQTAIEHTGAHPNFVPVNGEDALQSIHEYAYAFESVAGSLSFPMYAVYRALRADNVVVSLDGQGGDELFAGYPAHLDRALIDHPMWRAPRRRIDLLRTRHALQGRDTPMIRQLRRAVYSMRRGRTAATPAPRQWIEANTDNPVDLMPQSDRAALGDLGALNGYLYTAFHFELPNLLRNFDRMSMAHGVESRMPFMDWRVVAFAFALPGEAKVGHGTTKRIVREAMRGIMPESLRVRRSKVGFTSPMTDWFNGPMGEWVAAEVAKPEFVDVPYWDGPAIRDFAQARQASHTWTFLDCRRVWTYVQTHLWRQQFFETSPPALPEAPPPRAAAPLAGLNR